MSVPLFVVASVDSDAGCLRTDLILRYVDRVSNEKVMQGEEQLAGQHELGNGQ